MTELWKSIDAYISEHLVRDDEGLLGALGRADDEGLPPIQVSAPQGKMLELLVTMLGARRVLEIGTLGGYSTIRLARGVTDAGSVTTLELDPHHAAVARESLEAAGMAERVSVLEGPALDTLDHLIATDTEPFDLFFIDADKPSNPAYVERALLLSRLGSVLVVDNVVREGRILEESSDAPEVLGTRRLYELLDGHPRLSATSIQTVGSKGHDGFVLAVVVA